LRITGANKSYAILTLRTLYVLPGEALTMQFNHCFIDSSHSTATFSRDFEFLL